MRYNYRYSFSGDGELRKDGRYMNDKDMKDGALVAGAAEWFDAHGRDLPWRRDVPRDPEMEIMLQQTKVEAVRPYYDSWMDRFSRYSYAGGGLAGRRAAPVAGIGLLLAGPQSPRGRARGRGVVRRQGAEE